MAILPAVLFEMFLAGWVYSLAMAQLAELCRWWMLVDFVGGCWLVLLLLFFVFDWWISNSNSKNDNTDKQQVCE